MKKRTKILLLLLLLLILILVIFYFHKKRNEPTQANSVNHTQRQETPDTTNIINTLKTDTTTIDNTKTSTPTVVFFKPNALEIPSLLNHTSITTHPGFSLCYSEQHEQAYWVAYEFTKSETIKAVNRSNRFKPDPKIETKSAEDRDYKKSGYDRGHLAPAADMAWSKESMEASFYFSNMSPQVPSFNRGIWKKLEEQIRTWVKIYDTLYIATGPILTNELPSIGLNQVSIPEYYYKVVLDYKKSRQQAIGFLLPNENSNSQLQHFVVSIDSIEKLTSIDFFHQLDNHIENQLESNTCVSCWIWQKTTSNQVVAKLQFLP